jgi:hypothetical protein
VWTDWSVLILPPPPAGTQELLTDALDRQEDFHPDVTQEECYDQYQDIVKKCRLRRTAASRAICYAEASGILAACQAIATAKQIVDAVAEAAQNVRDWLVQYPYVLPLVILAAAVTSAAVIFFSGGTATPGVITAWVVVFG